MKRIFRPRPVSVLKPKAVMIDNQMECFVVTTNDLRVHYIPFEEIMEIISE